MLTVVSFGDKNGLFWKTSHKAAYFRTLTSVPCRTRARTTAPAKTPRGATSASASTASSAATARSTRTTAASTRASTAAPATTRSGATSASALRGKQVRNEDASPPPPPNSLARRSFVPTKEKRSLQINIFAGCPRRSPLSSERRLRQQPVQPACPVRHQLCDWRVHVLVPSGLHRDRVRSGHQRVQWSRWVRRGRRINFMKLAFWHFYILVSC